MAGSVVPDVIKIGAMVPIKRVRGVADTSGATASTPNVGTGVGGIDGSSNGDGSTAFGLIDDGDGVGDGVISTSRSGRVVADFRYSGICVSRWAAVLKSTGAFGGAPLTPMLCGSGGMGTASGGPGSDQ